MKINTFVVYVFIIDYFIANRKSKFLINASRVSLFDEAKEDWEILFSLHAFVNTFQ